MSAFDLDAFVGRSRALVESTPPATRRETRTWLVDPLLETLGWDVRADTCLHETTVDGTRLEYVTAVGGVPALLVAVEPYGESLDRDRAVSLLETMAWTGIDRAIYTDGRDFLLLAGTTDANRLACRLAALPDHESALAHYTRETIGQRLERHSRPFVARQLAVARDGIVASIVDELTAVTDQGDAYRAEFDSAADRFVERLVAAFSDDGQRPVAGELEAADADVSFEFSEPGSSSDESEATRQSMSTDESRPNHPSTGDPDASTDETSATEECETDADAGADAADGDESQPDGGGDAARASASRPERSDSGADEGGGEYVVRFFNERGSIGAIGHSSSDRALVAAAEYLFERGLSGLSVPWCPDDGDDTRAVLHESPTHPDGTPMTAPRQLSNGLYLETGGDVAQRADRVEALTARAGFRAMLTGDWD
ncbi:hypothetical protein C477_20439 [Haloterrigena salina JCM 13891]|uniref:Type I restriction enzyme R protein N-terminal domain-containing protein n=1 Tax=Haloterrigena salina JCM 13891 TaxID=1227488 RepID=M0BUD2_9EURY|nr:hypothetical protein [Haloterrigena salina]ELZ14545.1 hypothetical protein C477_20439 [Haloterrigena salina JCM 13891]